MPLPQRPRRQLHPPIPPRLQPRRRPHRRRSPRQPQLQGPIQHQNPSPKSPPLRSLRSPLRSLPLLLLLLRRKSRRQLKLPSQRQNRRPPSPQSRPRPPIPPPLPRPSRNWNPCSSQRRNPLASKSPTVPRHKSRTNLSPKISTAITLPKTNSLLAKAAVAVVAEVISKARINRATPTVPNRINGPTNVLRTIPSPQPNSSVNRSPCRSPRWIMSPCPQ